MPSKDAYKKIAEKIKNLAAECYTEKYPISIFMLAQNPETEEHIRMVVSPAVVEYDKNIPEVKMFYDLQNVMAGTFTTVPTQSKEEEDDFFEI